MYFGAAEEEFPVLWRCGGANSSTLAFRRRNFLYFGAAERSFQHVDFAESELINDF